MQNYNKISEGIYEIPKDASMKLPARIYATEKLLNAIENGAIQQLKNVASLPGVQKYAIGEADMHWGYGFPIGGVAGMNVDGGVVSPGGVGFDINCGVRLIKTNMVLSDVKGKLRELLDVLFREIPSGLGSKGKLRLQSGELREAVESGAKWAVGKGYGTERDLQCIEEYGCMKQADADRISSMAMQRGMPQFGTLGSGNHFLEIQLVDKIFDGETAKEFGLFEDQIVVMLHTGSRGFGHQVASDYIEVTDKAMRKYGISVPDRQLACAPINSDEGQFYFEAMCCAVNYAFCNRQVMTHWIRESFASVLGKKWEELGMDVLYDICHNVAKLEEHEVEGKMKNLLVHRKGATRAFPAGRKENPEIYSKTGHPAIIPGSMGTASYVCVGTQRGLEETFGSVAHGAGRVMSRTSATKQRRGEEVKKALEEKGEFVRGASAEGLAEEAPEAYKDIDEVALSIELSGIGKKVSRHVPLAVMKG